MTPYQGDTPNQPQGRQPSGTEYQQPPIQPAQQPPAGQYQGQPAQPPQQVPQGQPQPMQQYQQSVGQGQIPQGQVPQAQPPQQPGGRTAQQPGGRTAQMGPAGAQPQAGGAAQLQQMAQPGQPGVGPAQQASLPRMRPVRVEEIVQTDVVTVQRDTPIATVVARMAEEDVGSVVVVENDQPVGIITDRKVALALENTPDIANKQAGELVSGDLVTGTTSITVFDALQQLSDQGIRRLPIVGDDGTLQGIVTLDDILVLLANELDQVSEIISAQTPRL